MSEENKMQWNEKKEVEQQYVISATYVKWMKVLAVIGIVLLFAVIVSVLYVNFEILPSIRHILDVGIKVRGI